MTKLQFSVELTYNSDIMHGDSPQSVDWFFGTILSDDKGKLSLFSDEIGDTVGDIRVLKLLPVKTFEEVVKPVMEWLANNRNPHNRAIISSAHAELVEDVIGIRTNEFIQTDNQVPVKPHYEIKSMKVTIQDYTIELTQAEAKAIADAYAKAIQVSMMG